MPAYDYADAPLKEVPIPVHIVINTCYKYRGLAFGARHLRELSSFPRSEPHPGLSTSLCSYVAKAEEIVLTAIFAAAREYATIPFPKPHRPAR